MKYQLNSFIKDLEELHIVLSDDQLNQFLTYYELLTEWNSFMNLTAITDFDEVFKKHFIDSISLVKAEEDIFCMTGKNMRNDILTVIDIGTGAGFPGIPLKIVFPNMDITLLDSLNKRVHFLNEVIESLQLKGITAIHGRAEDFARKEDYRNHFDLAVSRAVANMSTLSEYCIPFVRMGGLFIPYKSEKISEELAHANNALSVLGGSIENQIEYTLPESDYYRNLVIIRKEKDTPKKYPRKAGLPSKEPLK
ncbi:MAG: 16S rRNA (guanine(527)-N(7))-methyltransferase RsmG [Roseburia sp.]|nr:16S rRNA (guanine(527)-N(7))-methyltransferase RsmG [Roseburia sp.]